MKGVSVMKKHFIFVFALVLSLTISITLINSSLADQLPLLVFTENSSSNLTATVNGVSEGTVGYLSPDYWYWSPVWPAGATYTNSLAIGESAKYWEEAPGSTLGNYIGAYDLNGQYAFAINSEFDTTAYPGMSAVPNGTTLYDHLELSFDNGQILKYDVQFIDNGDVSTSIPEPTTMLLLGLGLMGLAGVRRKFKK
jgi:PEP-CTERM motif